MSRGLGALQHRILDALPQTKDQVIAYHGCSSHRLDPEPDCRPGWVNHRRARLLLAKQIYDLRAVARLLADRAGYERYEVNNFVSGFSRAVRGLLKRRMLVAPKLIQIDRVEHDPQGIVQRLADGRYFAGNERQIRFVCLP